MLGWRAFARSCEHLARDRQASKPCDAATPHCRAMHSSALQHMLTSQSAAYAAAQLRLAPASQYGLDGAPTKCCLRTLGCALHMQQVVMYTLD